MTEKNSTEPIISIRHVWKYFGQLPALQDVSLDIAPGERVVIIGPSGSGKSTLLRSINRLEEIDGGSIIVNGQDINDKANNINEMRRNLGMVFQQFNLYPHLTVLENVTLAPIKVRGMGKKEATDLAMELLGRVGIARQAAKRPSEISGGQQQRAAIARALVQRARVLLADEPIASLDPESARNVMQTLRDLNQKDGLTVVVTLHQVDYAMRFCPRTVALKKGEIVYDGPTERLTPQFLAELYGAESDELFAAKTSAAQEAVTLPGSPVRETSRAA